MTSIGTTGAHSSRRQPPAPTAPAAMDVRHRDKQLAQARRHTLLVRVLRVVLPLSVLASFGFYAVLLKTSFSVGPGTLRPGKIEVTADDLKMKHPSYFGVTKDNGKYEVRAREAVVDMAMAGPIKLEGIDGDLFQASGVKTNLKATRGTLDNKQGALEMFDGVDITSSNGMVAHLLRAHVKTKEHYVSSHDPLTADMPAGRLSANGMEFWSDKKVAHFFNDISLRLTQQPTTNGQVAAIGLGGDARQPVDIRSLELDVDDSKSIADFSGQVVATQGETQLSAPHLHVTYQGRAVTDLATAGPTGAVDGAAMPGNATQLTRLEAFSGIELTAGTDRRLIADRVDFDVAADTALFTGTVELRQAKNVFRGGRLAVDRKAGKSRLDSPSATPNGPPGRIAATLVQTPDPAKPPAGGKTKPATAWTTTDTAGAAFGGFHSDPNAPTDIEADTLDVNDQTKEAIFRGRVVATQGEYVIKTAELVAHYTGQTGLMTSGSVGAPVQATPKGAAPSAGAQLTQLETKGGTKIVTKDGKEADGMNAHFDLKANQVTMDGPGGVTLRQGQNITRGAKMRMDLTKGEAHIENAGGGQANGAKTPTAAQLSIAAKPGIAPPVQPGACQAGGQSCMIFYPDQLKQTTQSPKTTPQSAPAAKAAQPKLVPAETQVSPSVVYRSN